MGVYVAPLLAVHPVPAPPLEACDACCPVMYWAIGSESPLRVGDDAVNESADWRGGVLYMSRDGSTYEEAATVQNESIMGFTSDVALPSPIAAAGMQWDDVSTVKVEIMRGTLTTRTANEVLNGANRILVGGEVLAFRTATLVGVGPNGGAEYTLSGLLRGLMGTDPRFTHTADEFVVVIDPANLTKVKLGLGDHNADLYWKAVAAGGDIDDVDAIQVPYIAGSMMPLPVVDVKTVVDGSDVDFTWSHRTRGDFRLMESAGDRLCCCDSSHYYIHIEDGSSNVVRIEEVTTQAFTYTSAMATADGNTPGVVPDYKIYQASSAVGLGLPFTKGDATVSTTDKLGLEKIDAGQGGGEVKFNEAIEALSTFVGLAIQSSPGATSAQPGSPSQGDAYILPSSSSTGTDWAGNDDTIAYYTGSAWRFVSFEPGMRAFVVSKVNKVYAYNGTDWVLEPGNGNVADAIAASTTQTQGQQQLAAGMYVHRVSTVSNADDVVTLPAIEAQGDELIVINDGANQLQVFPDTGDSIDAEATNASVTLAVGERALFKATSATQWITLVGVKA